MDIIELFLLGLYLVFVTTFTYTITKSVIQTIINLPISVVILPAMLGGLLAEMANKKYKEIKENGNRQNETNGKG
jgi:uncharacterized integral membrane protein